MRSSRRLPRPFPPAISASPPAKYRSPIWSRTVKPNYALTCCRCIEGKNAQPPDPTRYFTGNYLVFSFPLDRIKVDIGYWQLTGSLQWFPAPRFFEWYAAPTLFPNKGFRSDRPGTADRPERFGFKIVGVFIAARIGMAANCPSQRR